MKKITFIVIAFNEENTIKRCIMSILFQMDLDKYNYKIIIINDGSIDDTGEVAKELKKMNSNIEIIEFKENKGRGFARHEGVKRSKGDYVIFVDADIYLPKIWLKKTMSIVGEYDAVGGIALPDSDSTYICQKFDLEPIPQEHTFGITGSNSIYKRSVFKKININPNLRGGEDTDLNIEMIQAGYKIKLLNNLIVNHREDINFTVSLKRMYSFGKGATNLLKKHKKIRVPDVTFFIFSFLLFFTILLLIKQFYLSIILLVAFPLFVSYLHLYKKFKIQSIKNFIVAGLLNYFMIYSYFFGRFVGFMSKE